MLELSALEKDYGEFSLGPLDLQVGEEVLAVLGPSGSGKTTLLSLVAGVLQPDGGSITLDGRSLAGTPLERRRVGLVFQDGALFPHMTARENVAYATDDETRVSELASMLEIGDVLDRRPGALSGGEVQRVALARTLATEPDALLLDEPLNSLDAPVRRRLRDEIHDLFADLAVPIVYVTHDQRAATALGDRVAVLRDGALEQVGTPAAVLRRPASRFVATFTGTENVVDADVIERGDGWVELRLGETVVRATGDAPAGATVTACVRPSRLSLGGPTETFDGRETNVVEGVVRRFANEGNEYRVVVAVDTTDLVASVRPARFERLGLATGDAVRLAVAPDDVHLLT